MILETVCVGPFEVNCYIVAAKTDSPAIIIDPGDEENKIRRTLTKHKLKPALIINTHGHIDHIGCDDKFALPIYVHREDALLLQDPALNLSNLLTHPFIVKSEIRAVEDGGSIELGQLRFEVIHVPGHTPGGICLLLKGPQNKVLFTGDTLFFRGIGRTDFPGSEPRLLIKSISEKLLILSDDTVIYPGHGPSSTIGEEKKHNPFFI